MRSAIRSRLTRIHFTPKNVTKDMKRALNNLEKALDGKE